MVDYAKFRHTSPSIAFLFARLEGLLDSSDDRYPQIRDFIVGDSSLDLALGNLYLLLQQSLSWFKYVHGVLRRENMGSRVRSSGQERGLSSGMAVDGVVTDTATSVPSSAPSSILPSTSTTPHPFHALKEKCALKADIFNKFRDRFQFPNEIRARLPQKGEKACAFAKGEVYFMRLCSCAA